MSSFRPANYDILAPDFPIYAILNPIISIVIQYHISCLYPKLGDVFLTLHSSLVSPHIECAIQPSWLHLLKGKHHLERTQSVATRWVKGLRGLTYEERLKVLKLQSLERRQLGNDLSLNRKVRPNPPGRNGAF